MSPQQMAMLFAATSPLLAMQGMAQPPQVSQALDASANATGMQNAANLQNVGLTSMGQQQLMQSMGMLPPQLIPQLTAAAAQGIDPQAAAAAMQQIMGQQANAQAKIGNVGGLSVLPGHDISFLPHLAQRGGPNQTS